MRAIGAAALLLSLLGAAGARAADPRVVLYVDRDDDDVDGRPDGEQAAVPEGPELAAAPGAIASLRGVTPAVSGVGRARVLADGAAIAEGAAIPAAAARVAIQATRAGRLEIALGSSTVKASAIELRALDGEGREVDLTRSHASLQRTPPARLADDPTAVDADPDSLRFLVIGHADDLPGTLTLTSFAPSGAAIDALPDLPLFHATCPAGTAPELTCGTTLLIRAVADDIDRNHPLTAARSIKAELGGALGIASPDGEDLMTIRVAGPRRSPIGEIVRYRAKLRVRLFRLAQGGPPAIGGDDPGALAAARAEVERASALWAACGIGFGPAGELDVRVVDPPKPHLVAIGCDHGLPASGGAIRLRVDGRGVSATIAPGTKPAAAARVVAAAIEKAGLAAIVSDNAAIGAGAFGSADVLVRRKDGALAAIEPPANGPVSSDATLTACVGRVDLDDGLQHFGDVDAIAGTVEERALIKAFDDGDPRTIEVFLIPSFAGGGRIGESFIFADGGAIRNLLIEDRAGVRSDRASSALAHELGHVLLDEPGHPDDFGVDTPTRLMDADAANPSAYGPRRLTVDECARAIRQSGPGGPSPLLEPWPLAPLGQDGKAPAPGKVRSARR